ncbi:MAG TPA: biotin--[acetyl-CoA-carboxylase] ligase [Thermomicrobiales bacterium]|nr:biotin--[acetyl-CoA-carboxylase] ligase [Thermomicrobiales bacterium]
MNGPEQPPAGQSPWQIEWHAELPSTMTRARDLAESDAPAGTVVVADYQSEGRGTHGRIWLAPPDGCLMFTLIARPAIPIETLSDVPLRVSESVADCLRAAYGVECEVKPPNDITIGGKKLAGVLCTSRLVGERLAWLLVGIGLNTRMSVMERPFETATSLAIEGVAVTSHNDLLLRILDSLGWLLEPDLS